MVKIEKNDAITYSFQGNSFYIGHGVIYKGEKSQIICTDPIFVVRTRKGVVCGDIKTQIKYPDR